ncbi:hypothetical protein DRQ36_10490, partial [bacterium]
MFTTKMMKLVIGGAFALFFFTGSTLAEGSSYYWALPHIPPESLERYDNYSFDLRRRMVVSALKEHADSNQTEPLRLLRELESRGIVSDIRPLWICDVIRFKATTEALEIIEKSSLDGYVRESRPEPAELFDPLVEMFVPPPGDSLAWGLELVGAPEIWQEYGIDGSGVLVALLDSGVDFGSPDLIDALWVNSDEIPDNGIDDDGNGYIDDWRGYDWTETDGWPHDERGHGTHVAGIIGGRGAMGIGTGVAPGCTIMPLKILDSSGNGEEADVWEAIQYAIEHGARVMNMSIGWRYSGDPDRATWRATIESACAVGIVMCIAGGNENGYSGAPNNLRTPGDVPRALTVGATTIDDERADFSSVGPVAWDTISGYWDYPYPPGLIKPDICAPGDSVISIVNGGEYEYWNGTSMACPHITGAVALLLQLDSMLTHDSVKALIESSAVELGPAGKDSAFGSGRLNIPALFTLMTGFGWIKGNTEPGARIEVDPTGAWVFADDWGEFLIKLPEDSYSITADAFGFEPSISFAVVTAGDTTVLNLPLTPGAALPMRFVVRDFDTGEPIPGAGIIFEDWPSGTLWADVNGRLTEIITERDPALAVAFKPGYISAEDSINIAPPDTGIHYFYLHKAVDFESGPVLTHWGSIDDWEWGIPISGPLARSGSHLWATRLDTTYSDTTDSWLRLGVLDLSGEVEAPAVAFWQWYELEATARGSWDGGNIKLSTATGGWEILPPEGGYPSFLDDFNPITGGEVGFSGEFGHLFWHEVRFPLDGFVGDTVELVIHMGSDNNTVRRGWFIDDLALLPRTKRGPIFRYVEADYSDGTVAVSGTLYAVTDPIDTTEIFVCGSGASDDTIALNLFGEYFYGEFTGPFATDTLYIWLSAEDISGRLSLYPQFAPDSVIAISVVIDTAVGDTVPPCIDRWAYWPERSTESDSARLLFIISDDSPVTAKIRWSEGGISDSISPGVISADSHYFAIPLATAGVDNLFWELEVFDTAGNNATDRDTIE